MPTVRLIVLFAALLMALAIMSPTWPIIDVTPEEQTTLEDTARAEYEVGHMRAWKRCQAILLLAAGERVAEVARKLDCSTKTVYQWVGRWRDYRFEGIRFKMNEQRPAHYQRKVDFDDRVALILAMRGTGMKWAAIAQELGYVTRAGPMQFLKRAIAEEDEEGETDMRHVTRGALERLRESWSLDCLED